MAKKYLITGGAGFLGSAITKALLAEGHKIVVLDNLQRGNLTRLKDLEKKFDFVSADIRDTKKVVSAAKGCDGIIHLAYVNGTKFFYSKPDLILDIAVRGMQSVIAAGKENKVKELFLASSSEVYQLAETVPTPEDVKLIIPDPYNPRYSYGGGKILSELLAIHMGKDIFKKVVIFRPHNVYGPDMGREHVIPEFIERLSKIKKDSKNSFKIQGSGNETRSYIYIDDFTQGFLLILKKGKNMATYNIGVQDEITSKKLAGILAKIMDRKIKIKTGSLREGSTPRRCPDTAKLQSLGFKKSYTLEQGLGKTADWYTN